ncbi:hypothetical protein ACS126_02435 [Sphingobacterium lactis]|uniref:hypothetical protein n=1 Tax=Sphingobacterium lactis TaxID=797291 RepID=UPI003EC62C37
MSIARSHHGYTSDASRMHLEQGPGNGKTGFRGNGKLWEFESIWEFIENMKTGERVMGMTFLGKSLKQYEFGNKKMLLVFWCYVA